MTLYIHDSFTDTDGTNLTNHTCETGSTWVNGWNGANCFIDAANNAMYSTVDGNIVNTQVIPVGDYSVIGIIHAYATKSNLVIGLTARWQSNNNRYCFSFTHGIGWKLARVTSGSESQIGSTYGSSDLVNGQSYTAELRCAGSTISAYVNGVLAATGTDATYSSGKAGMEVPEGAKGNYYEMFDFIVQDISNGTTFTYTSVGGTVLSGNALINGIIPPPPVVQPYIIDPTRTCTWKGSVGIPNGIPNTSTVFQTLSSGTSSSTIQTAINSAATVYTNSGSNDTNRIIQIVLLSAGTTVVSGTITLQSGVILRGAGIGSTILSSASLSSNIVQIGSGGSYSNTVTPSGATQGATILTNCSGFSVGDIVFIDCNDGGIISDTGNWGGGGKAADGTRNAGQLNKIINVNGSTITLETPLCYNWGGNSPSISKVTLGTRLSGVESLTIKKTAGAGGSDQGGSTAAFLGTDRCWFKNVEVYGSYIQLVYFRWTYRCQILGGSFHEGIAPVPYRTSYGYGLRVTLTSGLLIENAEVYHLFMPIMCGQDTSVNVLGYNYFHDYIYDANADGNITNDNQACGTVRSHQAHSMMWLLEGNYMKGGVEFDNDWGTQSHFTMFRNRMVLDHNRLNWTDASLAYSTNSSYNNAVGNVIGDGIESSWQTTWGSGVASILQVSGTDNHLEHANWDSVHNGYTYSDTNHNLDDSLYLDAPPSWYPGMSLINRNSANNYWPPYGPAAVSGVTYISYPSGGVIAGGSGIPVSLIQVANGGVIVGGGYVNGTYFVSSGGICCSDVSGVVGVPDPPWNVLAIGGIQQVRIQFDNSAGASSYNLYWSTLPNVTTYNSNKISNITNPFFHAGLQPNSTFYYIVTSYNTFGEGNPSTQVSATTPSDVINYPYLPPPLPPGNAIEFPVVPLNLIDKLPSYFDKESNPLPIIDVTSSNVLNTVISDDHRILTINCQLSSVNINIKGSNIAQIKNAIQLAGFTINELDLSYDNLLNHTLVNDPNDPVFSRIHFEQSLNIRLMNGIEQFLLDNINIFLNGLNETYFKLADSDWLNLWCNYFGFNRRTAESDPKVLTRTINGITAIKLNNFAMMKMLISEIGINCDISDCLGIYNAFLISFSGTNVSTLPQNQIDTIMDVVDQYRAGGCYPVYTAPGELLKTNEADLGQSTNSSNWGTYPQQSPIRIITLTHS